jgi:hypothetical protein
VIAFGRGHRGYNNNPKAPGGYNQSSEGALEPKRENMGVVSYTNYIMTQLPVWGRGRKLPIADCRGISDCGLRIFEESKDRSASLPTNRLLVLRKLPIENKTTEHGSAGATRQAGRKPFSSIRNPQSEIRNSYLPINAKIRSLDGSDIWRTASVSISSMKAETPENSVAVIIRGSGGRKVETWD